MTHLSLSVAVTCQGHPFCKISVRRSKNCLEFSTSKANAAFCAKRETSTVRSARRGDEKNKAPVTSPCSDSSNHLRQQVLTDGGDVKRTKNDPLIKNCHLSGYEKHRQ